MSPIELSVSRVSGRDRAKRRKVQAIATVATYIAGLCDHRDALVPGERGVLLCGALDQRVAKIILDYAEACFERSPILKQLIAGRTADALELTNGISLEVRPASFRKLRGPTYIAVIADELAFWYVDTAYANPDVEILNAVEPGLATTGGPLILASSPHARRGALWDVFKRHYGAGGDPLILVAHGATRTLNPSLPQRVVDRALEKDRARAMAEYLAQFRTDVEGFVAPEIIEGCTGDYREMLPARQLHEFVDNAQVDDKTRLQLRFYARQFIDAMSSSNFPATNPEVIRKAIETRSVSLTDGMQNLIDDLQKGRITRVDELAFEVGRKLAITPGSVVFENELIQLIQYAPQTGEVEKTPLLIVPPCINKFYLLDLVAGNYPLNTPLRRDIRFS